MSYRDLEQPMGERGVSGDLSTIFRWGQKDAPEIEKHLRWQWCTFGLAKTVRFVRERLELAAA